MILNSYAVLTVFVAAVRVLLALAVLVLAIGQLRARHHAGSHHGRDTAEHHGYLAFLLVVLLLGLNFISWPLLYLLLNSYVPTWSGVMCIYGVTRIGADSIGPSGWLPTLLAALQWSKPALVFVGGGWFVLYALNRQTVTGPLLPRLFVVLPVLALLVLADAAVELAYVAIPKIDVQPSSGCCTVASADGLASWFTAAVAGEDRTPLWLGYYGGNLVLAAALAGTAFGNRAPGGWRLGGLLALGVVTAAVSGAFLSEVAAPMLLKLPFHRCVYDLVPHAPEAILAIALYIAGLFSLGWAGVADVCGRSPQTAAQRPGLVRRLLRLSLWTYLASLLMMSLELGLA